MEKPDREEFQKLLDYLKNRPGKPDVWIVSDAEAWTEAFNRAADLAAWLGRRRVGFVDEGFGGEE